MPEIRRSLERVAPKLTTQGTDALQQQVAELQAAVERIEKQQASLGGQLEMLSKIEQETRSLFVELNKEVLARLASNRGPIS
jgi:septation ring formation regulator EzrA